MVRDVEATVADLRGKGVAFEDYDLPGVKTINGIAELGGIKGAWFGWWTIRRTLDMTRGP